MVKSGGKNGNGWLVGILVGLGVVIVGLVVGIAVVNVNNGDRSRTDEVDYDLPEELTGEDLSPEDQVIKETSIMLQTPGVSMEEIENYYDVVVDKAISDGDTYLAVRIVIQKMNFLAVVEEDCGKSKEYIDSVDLSPYSEEEKRYLASYKESMIGGCNEPNINLQDGGGE